METQSCQSLATFPAKCFLVSENPKTSGAKPNFILSLRSKQSFLNEEKTKDADKTAFTNEEESHNSGTKDSGSASPTS